LLPLLLLLLLLSFLWVSFNHFEGAVIRKVHPLCDDRESAMQTTCKRE
jgi:hypothetical protein